MFCQSCGTKLPDDASYCLKCGTRLRAGNIIEPERTLSKSNVDHQRWSDFLNEYAFESGATLEVTNKRVIVSWDKHTLEIPLNRVGSVEMKKGGWFSFNELSISGVGVFRFDNYEKLTRVAQLISSLTSPLVGAASQAIGEKTEFTVVLKEIGANKINVVKAVRELTDLGLKEALDLVEAVPIPVMEYVNKEDADNARQKLEIAGAKVEII